MTEDRAGLQRKFAELLGDRFKREEDPAGPLGVFSPLHAEEVGRLAEAAARYGVPVVPAGGGTATGSAGYPHDGIVVSLGLMKNIRLRHNGGGWAEAEPGTLWLALDNELRQRGKGLAVYPTSAPRATIGGWLATDGLGVGSFEHGWLRENVLAADVVLPGGELREVPGSEVPGYTNPEKPSGIVVAAKLRTRRADTDRPFVVAFEREGSLLRTLSELALDPSSVPLWHVGFLNPEMARLRGLTPAYLMFGAYPGHRAAELEDVFWPAVAAESGESLGAAESYRVWGERFAPLTPSRPTPRATREFSTIGKLLSAPEPVLPDRPAQGTLSRSGEVLILTLEDGGRAGGGEGSGQSAAPDRPGR